ncbi:MAG: hypothetical protein NVSMB31_14880 [Vulcanimicrobiaceae bacterium]
MPDHFAFSVKIPKEITHVRKLVECERPLSQFIDETAALGAKRSVVLVQLPPKLNYDRGVANEFFEVLRSMYPGSVALEPRHASWFEPGVDQWLASIGIARVAADPATVVRAAEPGGTSAFTYTRLHGSPRMYYSAYPKHRLDDIAALLRDASDAWCIFDNTASGAATSDALYLRDQLAHH